MGSKGWRLTEVYEGSTVQGKDDRKLEQSGKPLQSLCAEGMRGGTGGKGDGAGDGLQSKTRIMVSFGRHREVFERIEARKMTR